MTFELTLRNGEVHPPPHRVHVERGARVRIVVRADKAGTVHLHGYDEEERFTPGRPAVIVFVADRVGVFAVETHHPSLHLLQLEVR